MAPPPAPPAVYGLVLGVLAALHLARAAWSFAGARADLGTLFDVLTAGLLGVAALLARRGARRGAAVALLPAIVLKGLEAAHAVAHLAAHGHAPRHALGLAGAAALGVLLAATAVRLARPQ